MISSAGWRSSASPGPRQTETPSEDLLAPWADQVYQWLTGDVVVQRKMALTEREELRRVGRENHATAGLVCPAHVRAAFNFEFDDIDIDVPPRGTPGRGVQGNSPLARDVDPLPGATGRRTASPRKGGETGSFSLPMLARSSRENSESSEKLEGRPACFALCRGRVRAAQLRDRRPQSARHKRVRILGQSPLVSPCRFRLLVGVGA